MASVNDWAARAAHRIYEAEQDDDVREDRIAAIIALHAEPLVTLLHESRRAHYHCEDSWYCCGKCTCGCADEHEHHASCYVTSHRERTSGVCSCGADAWNARIDATLDG